MSAVTITGVKPPPVGAVGRFAHVAVPDPSVFNTWLAAPSEVGNVYPVVDSDLISKRGAEITALVSFADIFAQFPEETRVGVSNSISITSLRNFAGLYK